MDMDTKIEQAAREIADHLQGRPFDSVKAYIDDAEMALLNTRHCLKWPAAMSILGITRSLTPGCALSAIKKAREIISAENRRIPLCYFFRAVKRPGVSA